MVRGRRQYLYDVHARAYLDCVNNVAVAGHSHPRITAAATRQLRLLNTNSRFLYEGMTRFAERLAALLPEPLERVFLVSTRIRGERPRAAARARRHGRRDVLCDPRCLPRLDDRDLRGLDELASTTRSARERSRVRASRAFARHLSRPDRRGRGPTRARATPRRCATRSPRWPLADARRPRSSARPSTATPAASSSPTATWRAAYAHVRAAGGLCIADEVQVGYGRLGAHFWGFEQQGVVPDIVTLAKATGNGHPVAAVDHDGRDRRRARGPGRVLRLGRRRRGLVRDRARGARRDRGGAPAGQRAGVGGALRAGLGELSAPRDRGGRPRHGALPRARPRARPRDQGARREEAYAICERLRERGAIVQPTGDGENVLKLKPPLVFERRRLRLAARDARRRVRARVVAKVLGLETASQE